MNNLKKNTCILIDTTFYLYKTYYTFPSLYNKFNEPTGAIYGILNLLNKILTQYPTQYIVLIFDSKEPTFRHKIYKKYKSHRLPMPINLRRQIMPIYQIIKAMGIPNITIPGIEADDIIGTIASYMSKENFFVLISSGDKDMAQLVTNNINLLDTNTNSILGPLEIHNKYGIKPELIIDLIALMGDKSDNIPGIPGIGKKTAILLLTKIGNLKQIYHNITIIDTLNIKGSKKITDKLITYKNNALLSYKLATIETNISLLKDNNLFKIKKPNITQLYTLFKHYELKQWLKILTKNNWLTKY
uniref:5'-3' exonuclease domain-containing protein n=1 Tax=Candidatus Aschnera chinzeii TaxID=1485666 RepID=A0AAT9G5A3_9ENTR|nr:MAG: hypothetical protein ACHINZ_5820 [Candidatus Aschnera chinzeii]